MFVKPDVREFRAFGITDFDKIIPTFCGHFRLIEIRPFVWPVGSPPPLSYHCADHSQLSSVCHYTRLPTTVFHGQTL
jgi:hypothetical protein